ncbi:unnamed protein product, partial [Urochloa humidicola]
SSPQHPAPIPSQASSSEHTRHPILSPRAAPFPLFASSPRPSPPNPYRGGGSPPHLIAVDLHPTQRPDGGIVQARRSPRDGGAQAGRGLEGSGWPPPGLHRSTGTPTSRQRHRGLQRRVDLSTKCRSSPTHGSEPGRTLRPGAVARLQPNGHVSPPLGSSRILRVVPSMVMTILLQDSAATLPLSTGAPFMNHPLMLPCCLTAPISQVCTTDAMLSSTSEA